MDHTTPPTSEPTAVVLDRSAPARGTVPLRTVLGANNRAPQSHGRLGRAAWALVGVACVAGAVGVVEVLFPETGPATAESVWQTPSIAREDAPATTLIATADIDFKQVSADAWARSAQEASSTSVALGTGAPSSVLGTVVSAGPAAGGGGTPAKASAPSSGSNTSGSSGSAGNNASSSTTTRPATQPVTTSPGSSSSSSSTTTATTRNSSTPSSTTTATTRNSSTSSSTATTAAPDTSTSIADTSTSGPDDNGGGSGSGKGSSGGGGSGKG